MNTEENKELLEIRNTGREGLTIKDPAHMSVQIKQFNDTIYFVGSSVGIVTA